MAVTKLLNLFAISSLAVILCSYGTTPANALSSDHGLLHAKSEHSHGAIAKRKRALSSPTKTRRDSNGRCRPKPDSASTNSVTGGDDSGSGSGNGDNGGGDSNNGGGDNGNGGGDNNGGGGDTNNGGGGDNNNGGGDNNNGGGDNNGGGGDNNGGGGGNNNNGGGGNNNGGGGNNTSGGGGNNGGAGSNTNGNKLGYAWPNGDEYDLAGTYAQYGTYLYTWSESCPDNLGSLTCMPMLWSDGGDKIQAWENVVWNSGSSIFMGFNECNEPGQSNMSPQDAAQAWIQYIEPLKTQRGAKLVGPSMSSNPNGFTWYQQWFAACNGGCNPDWISIHYYDVSGQGMIDYLNQWYQGFGIPLMVTEFDCQNFNNGPQCSWDDILAFNSQVVEFMNSQPWIETFMPFGFMQDMSGVNQLNCLMNEDGSPNDLGQMFLYNSWSTTTS